MDNSQQVDSNSQAFAAALAHHRAGRLIEAAALYRQILDLAPGHADALHNSGLIAFQTGKFAEAAAFIEHAISINPNNPTYYSNLGPVYRAVGQMDEARAAYLKAIALAPNVADTHNNLGNLYRQIGKLDEALACYEKATRLKPDDPVMIYNLGGALSDLDKPDEASACFHRALLLKTDYAEAYNDLGKVYRLQGRMGEAIACYEKAIAFKPNYSLPHNNLAGILKVHGKPAEAVASYRRALACDPNYADAYSNMLFAMQYADIQSSSELFAEHVRFAERFEAPLKPTWQAHANRRDPNRRLRIGYLSPDFRHHAVAYFIEPVLAQHDKVQVEVYCYHNSSQCDGFTKRIQAAADRWIPCKGLSDQQLSDQIRHDQIDILVDLVGHTAGNRLLVFARKPAPLQVTWLGYFGSTGLSAMDYRFTDAYMDPPGYADSIHTEKLVRLPYFSPFQPAENSPDVNPLPALTAGRFTFASLNNLAKLNRAVVKLWARILKSVPDSQLMLCNIGDGETKKILFDMFAAEEIEPDRLSLQAWLPIEGYLALHHLIDLALDPFPYNGGTITNHSLWMGVPVVTLEGDRPVARIGASLMRRAGLPEFITRDQDEYWSRAVELTQDLSHLNSIRQSLRVRIKANSVADPKRITEEVEQAFRSMWQRWCAAQ